MASGGGGLAQMVLGEEGKLAERVLEATARALGHVAE